MINMPDPSAQRGGQEWIASFQRALAAVKMVVSSDRGEFPHGDNRLELDALVTNGVSPAAVQASTVLAVVSPRPMRAEVRKKRTRGRGLPCCLALIALSWSVWPASMSGSETDSPAPDAAWEASGYEKTEVLVPMRDGVSLFTAIYRPRSATEPSPILLTRTPYSCAPYGEDHFPEVIYPDPVLVREGYTLVCQDVRGTHRSEGAWVHMRPHRSAELDGLATDESTDAWDTIDWLVRYVPGNNGRVCLWGASYPGFYVAASMIDPHPALACALPQAPQSDWWYEDVHHNGAFFLAPVVGFLLEFGGPRDDPSKQNPTIDFTLPTRDGYRFFLQDIGPLGRLDELVFGGQAGLWNDIASHPNRDAFWRERDLRPRLAPVAPAVLNVGGWYDDSNLFGSLATYRAIEDRNPETFNVLAVGPWEHTGWEWEASGDRHGDIPFGSATSQFYRFAIQKPFLDFYARGLGPDWDRDGRVDLPEAWMFEVGANRWRAFETWPPSEAEPSELYLDAHGALSWDPPASAAKGDSESFDAFTSNPAKPVPFTERIVPFRDPAYMTADQRFASRRPDVLVYTTAPLAEPVTVAGPIDVDLWVSTDRDDADWVVKLVDVFPDRPAEGDWQPERRAGGYEMLVRGEVLRGRFRDDPAHPAPFPAGEPTRVTFTLPDVLHTFLPSHRLMVQIQSTWFPLVDRNPQRWVNNIYRAVEDDFRRATHKVYRSGSRASRLRLPLLAAQAPRATRRTPIGFRNPTWSTDGQWILFEANLDGGRAFDLWAVHRERSGLFRVPSAEGPTRESESARSPDGSRLAVIGEDADGAGVFLADPHGRLLARKTPVLGPPGKDH